VKETIIEKIKRESTGYGLLDPEFEEKEQEDSIRAWMAVVKRTGREITQAEERAINI
jgi:hypothetical protein